MGGGYQSRPDGMDEFARRLADLQRQINDLRSAAGVRSAVLSPGGSIRSADFDGTAFADPGTTGNYFGGDGAVLNALNLRPGSLENDALTNPLTIGQGNNGVINFALSKVADTTLVTINLTVPAGFTGFSCMAIGGVAAVNSTANLDFLLARIWIGNSYGDTLYQPCSGSNGSGHVTVFKQGQLTGLTSGNNVAVTLRAWTSTAAWAANTSNIASLNLLAFWLR